MITITDVRRVFCVAGTQKFAKEHSLDFRDFITNGISEDRLRELGADALVDRILSAKEGADHG